MERCCFTMTLRPGAEEEYRRRHDEIWPEMVTALKASGISDYTIFRRGRELYAFCSCEPDAATAFARMGATDVNRRWSAWFEDVLESLLDERGELRWAEQVWHLD
jgi:L-rhamnose mutarotase